ncbi:hypothetical protein GRAN_0090 [Granulicella sibirica]|uniref:Uncharacterized protein n=1 Tax=Granulicella sibirica TaxID=2479048 RepID=A0A4Q0T2W0_9BACT|nr:hypothetical protein GRAN_0090 [Granulicella sibirica]
MAEIGFDLRRMRPEHGGSIAPVVLLMQIVDKIATRPHWR